MTLNTIAEDINDYSHSHGFWDDNVPMGYKVMAKLLLINSEVAEATEELRRKPLIDWPAPGFMCDVISGKPEGFSVELADALIRTLDLMYECGIDIDYVVKMKMAYNKTRPYKHGKSV